MSLSSLVAVAVVVCLSLIASNFAYQAIYDRIWIIAAERSFFQCGAIGSLLVCAAIAKATGAA